MFLNFKRLFKFMPETAKFPSFRVLVLEDRDIAWSTVKNQLDIAIEEIVGAEKYVVRKSSPEEALAAALKEEWDIYFADISMRPGASSNIEGITNFVTPLHEHKPKAYIIGMSARPELSQKMMDGGATVFWEKGNIHDLYEILKTYGSLRRAS